ncbi:helix-turn-helix domain-containing protein [Azospirillum sp. sgz302134]
MSVQTVVAAQPNRSLPGYLAATIPSPTVTTLPKAAPRTADPLATIGHTKVLDREQAIFQEGDAADAIFRVIDGVIRLYKMLPDGRRQIIGFLQAGDMIGLAFAERYLYSAETVTAVSLQRIPRSQLDALMDAQPSLARRMLSLTTSELVAAQDQMVLLGRKTALEKLASFLLALAGRSGKSLIAVPMSRGDIADYLGLTTETVSRGFTKLKTAGMIRLHDNGKVELLDRDAIAGLAECA